MERPVLFRLDDVPDGGARGFDLREEDGREQRWIAVRQGDVLRVYENRCPHRGTPLDWAPDEFLNAERTHLVCATHGALFRIEDGVCTAGPCTGDELEPIPVELAANGDVFGPPGLERA